MLLEKRPITKTCDRLDFVVKSNCYIYSYVRAILSLYIYIYRERV